MKGLKLQRNKVVLWMKPFKLRSRVMTVYHDKDPSRLNCPSRREKII